MAAQGVVLLPHSAQLGGGRRKVLLVLGTQLAHGLPDVLRLVPTEPRLAHPAFFYVVINVNFGHLVMSPIKIYIYSILL